MGQLHHLLESWKPFQELPIEASEVFAGRSQGGLPVPAASLEPGGEVFGHLVRVAPPRLPFAGQMLQKVGVEC